MITSILSLLPVSFHERGIVRSGEFVALLFISSPAFKILGSMLSDALGKRKVFVLIGMFAGAAAIPGFVGLTGAPLVGALLILGYTIGVPGTMIHTAVIEHSEIGPGLAGSAVGFMMMLGNVGGLLGPIAAGRLMDVSGSTLPSFLFMSALCVASALIILPARMR